MCFFFFFQKKRALRVKLRFAPFGRLESIPFPSDLFWIHVTQFYLVLPARLTKGY